MGRRRGPTREQIAKARGRCFAISHESTDHVRFRVWNTFSRRLILTLPFIAHIIAGIMFLVLAILTSGSTYTVVYASIYWLLLSFFLGPIWCAKHTQVCVYAPGYDMDPHNSNAGPGARITIESAPWCRLCIKPSPMIYEHCRNLRIENKTNLVFDFGPLPKHRRPPKQMVLVVAPDAKHEHRISGGIAMSRIFICGNGICHPAGDRPEIGFPRWW